MENKTIEELIEMCKGEFGQRFKRLKIISPSLEKSKWEATATSPSAKCKKFPDSPITRKAMDFYATGNSPREAIVNLVNIVIKNK